VTTYRPAAGLTILTWPQVEKIDAALSSLESLARHHGQAEQMNLEVRKGKPRLIRRPLTDTELSLQDSPEKRKQKQLRTPWSKIKEIDILIYSLCYLTTNGAVAVVPVTVSKNEIVIGRPFIAEELNPD
jgi:hypothetical protein